MEGAAQKDAITTNTSGSSGACSSHSSSFLADFSPHFMTVPSSAAELDECWAAS